MTVEEAQAACQHRYDDGEGRRVYLHCQKCGLRDPHGMRERILIGKIDVTEHVAAMFDAIVQSMDWGSHFLDVETIESILVIAELAGFQVPEDPGCNPPGWSGEWNPERELPRDEMTLEQWREALAPVYEAWKASHAQAIAAWRAQVQARARAMAGGEL